MEIKIKTVNFIKSSTKKSNWPKATCSEILFVGRSNVGKSSLINSILNRKKMAKVANRPGKTQMLNFFNINDNQLWFVDAPGYGYAQVSKSQKIHFQNMMEEYFSYRKNLKLVIQIIDSRHKPSKDDINMYLWLQEYNIPVFIVATKLDKLKKNDIKKNKKIIIQSLPNCKDILMVSNQTKENIDMIHQYLALFV